MKVKNGCALKKKKKIYIFSGLFDEWKVQKNGIYLNIYNIFCHFDEFNASFSE